MKNFTLFRISSAITFFFLLVALFTPLASIAIDLSQNPEGVQSLDFVCVFCQYGDGATPAGAMIFMFTPLDFFSLWIPILGLLGISLIPLLKSFPNLAIAEKISDKLAVNSLWLVAILSITIRGIISLLVPILKNKFQTMFPENLILSELSWGSAALVFATISAITAAMFGFIEFQYDLETTSDTNISAEENTDN